MPMKIISEKKELERYLKGAIRSKLQVNRFYEADSEILKLGKSEFLTSSIDSFGEEWSIGLYQKLETLARVCVHGTLSDLVVTGADPLGFLFSPLWTFKDSQDTKKIIFETMIKELRKLKVPLLGGDEGRSKSLSLTGVALGRSKNKPIQRVGIKSGQVLCSLGSFGAGPALGLQFLLGLRKNSVLEDAYQPKAFISAIPAIRDFAKASMDGSDGFLSTLNTLSHLNDVHFEIDAKSIQTEKHALKFCSDHQIPRLSLWFGEVGDYQAIFTVEEGEFAKLKKRLPEVRRIGFVLPKRQKKHIFRFREKNTEVNLDQFFNLPRSTPAEYLEAFSLMLSWIEDEKLSHVKKNIPK